jgi:ATP-dependent Lon protease
MLSNNKSPDELVQLELVTWNDEEYQAESISYLEEIKDDVASLGIELSYRMEKHHDRYVAADNGWKITMGRGLDIFERNESRFDISNLDQTKRKCKACEFTYIKI